MITSLALSPAIDVTYCVDEVVVGAIHRPRSVVNLAGGKGLNLARAAQSLGAPVRTVAPLGGWRGKMLGESASAEGLALHVVRVAAETRECVSIVPINGGAPTEFYEHGGAIADHEWRDYLDLSARLPASGWSALSGRLPASLGTDNAIELLLTRREAGDRIALDSSGPGVAEIVAAVQPEVLKLNRYEASDLTGLNPLTDVTELTSLLRDRTGHTVVVTDGADGAVGLDDTGMWRAHPDPDPGWYAIGSGDSFLAGLLVSLDRGHPLGESLRDASAAGSANTRTIGAGRFAPADFSAAARRIAVTALNA